MGYVNARDVSSFADIAHVYGLPSTEGYAANLLASLPLQETVILCARLNAIVSGIGIASMERRNRAAMSLIALPKEEQRILSFTGPRGGYRTHAVFFRGQLLHLMRLAVRHCSPESRPGFYEAPKNRVQFLKVALVASALWTERTMASRNLAQLTEETVEDHVGYLRKIIEETNPAPNAINTIGRGWLLFAEHFPKHYPAFEDEFRETTRMTFDQYSTCVSGLMTYIVVGNELEGRVFKINAVGAATTYRGVFPEYLALDSQTPEQFAHASQGSQAEFEKAMWERPIILFPDGSSVIIDPVFFSAKLSVGPLFFLLRDHPERGRAVFHAFGLAFEDYANAIVRRMFGNARLNLKKANGKKTDFEVDAVAGEGPPPSCSRPKPSFSRRSSSPATSTPTSSAICERSTSARETPSGSSRRAPARSRSAVGRSFRTNSPPPPRSIRSWWPTTCAWIAPAPGCCSARR
ncbi:winged helix-turn-helix domain-containing protein [Bradyrhizobium diazoefficiens]|nr:helix-turn-helix domain-containing protein [Bradyrhizobium diazoefficiens]QQN62166.1 winged helix-turn-helix domain-containing protein [Bradyrhizobium diazoefficiens]